MDEELCKAQQEMYRDRALQKRTCKTAEDLEFFEASEDDYRERLKQIKLQKKDNRKKLKAVERCLEREGSLTEAELEYRIPVGDMVDMAEVEKDEVPGNPYRVQEDVEVENTVLDDAMEADVITEPKFESVVDDELETEVGDYYLGTDGTMATSTWIGQYYVDDNGKWVPNKQKELEKQEPTKQEIALQSIGLNQTSLKMWVGGSETLEVTCTPSNTTVDKTITWKSSNEKVATVKDGKVEAVGEGEVVITAEVAGKKASCTVNAKQYYRLFWEGYMNFLPVGSHGTIWIGDPDNLSAPYYHVYSLNEDIATTDNDGNLTGVSEGTATIVVEGDGKKGSIDIEVKKPAEFETAYLDQDVYTMKTGDKLQLHATVVPENALIEKRYYWGSKNPEVAEIDSEGVVRAMGIGEAEIICSLREIPLTSDGHDGSIFHYVTCKIKVDSVGTNTEFEDFKWELTDINNKGEYVKVGDIITPNIKVYPVTYPYNLKDVKFSIEKSEQEGSEEGIVEITDENKIKICKPGVAYIKAVLNGKEARMRFVCE